MTHPKNLFNLKIKIFFLLFLILNTAFAQTNNAQTDAATTIKNMFSAQLGIYLKPDCPLHQSYCILVAAQTGKLFEKQYGKQAFTILDNKMRKLFQKEGWQSNSHTQSYSADGPLATNYALQKANLLMIVSFNVSGNQTHCPTNQPVDLYQNCHLSSAQRIYTVKIKISQVK